MLDWLKSNTAAARERVMSEVARYKNKDVMQAIVASCAAMAFADGNVSSDEKKKLYGLLQNSDVLKVYSTDEVLAFFNQVVAKFEFDFDIGLAEALKTIGKVKKDEGAARHVVRASIMIGKSDGNFDDKEKDVARTIARELGLNPTDFDL
jgi:tellurite resistance protein TerB